MGLLLTLDTSQLEMPTHGGAGWKDVADLPCCRPLPRMPHRGARAPPGARGGWRGARGVLTVCAAAPPRGYVCGAACGRGDLERPRLQRPQRPRERAGAALGRVERFVECASKYRGAERLRRCSYGRRPCCGAEELRRAVRVASPGPRVRTHLHATPQKCVKIPGACSEVWHRRSRHACQGGAHGSWVF